MKPSSRVGIVGGGFAARTLARKLMYDFEVTVLSKTLYHLENERRVSHIFGRKLQEEDSLTKLNDLCNVFQSEIVRLAKKDDGSYEVTDALGKSHQFDRLILALGSHADKQHRDYFHTYHDHEFTTYTTMQSMRMRFMKNLLCRGQLRIVTGGLHSKNLFNAISVILFDLASLVLI